MDDRKLIGKGRIANIFSDGKFAYKTYPNDFPSSWIKYEVDVQNEIKKNTTLDVLSFEYLGDQREVKMGLIKGITLADRMRKLKYKNGLEDMIKLQIKTYDFEDLNLPIASKVFKDEIINSELKQDIIEKAICSLDKIQPLKKLCHFDFHLENIMFDQERYIIIDWVNAKLGHPVMDIARSYIIFKQHAKRLANKYLRLITKEMKIDMSEVYDALPIMAALRILETDDESFIIELEKMVLEKE